MNNCLYCDSVIYPPCTSFCDGDCAANYVRMSDEEINKRVNKVKAKTMSTIPKAVLETFPKKIYLQTTDEDEQQPYKYDFSITWCEDKVNNSDVEYLRADLATDGREELEKQLQDSLLLYNNQTATIIKLEKECEGKDEVNRGLQNACKKWEEICEGKEKEIAELKKQLEDSFLLYHNMTTTIATRDRQLSELEAEKERRGILIEKYFISTTMTDMVINGWSAEKASNETQKEWNKFKTENGL